ncbi:putative serine/threonine protein kinase [Starmerella bacillaris]|uniref:non-specific serine/threonine protein kinase n=1 Tax=Starmerella bacillaris TaxID=1247836 RepID=A0AAV5RNL1_STABA|nr:putative serine/threonine protein kinase [Starmerella bacillaris]
MPSTALASASTPGQLGGSVPAPTEVSVPQSTSAMSRLSALSALSVRQHRNKRLGKYNLGQTIGRGEFGKVKLAWATDANGQKKQFAVKLLRQDKLNDSDENQQRKVCREMNALMACRHPHIVHLEEVLRNENYIGIILEYASGGDMYTQIYKHGRLDERSAQRLFAQLVSGVSYMHQKGVVHRDLKLENLLLDSNQNILISDFGFANAFRTKSGGFQLMETSCGSPCYAAPEVVNSSRHYDGRKVDIWSVGVILFTFLAGYLPFDDDPRNPDSEDIQLLYRYIASTSVKFPEWINSESRDLLRRILVVDPERRARMQDIMAHRWLAAYRQFLSIIPSEHEGVAPWQQRRRQSHAGVQQQPQNPRIAKSAHSRNVSVENERVQPPRSRYSAAPTPAASAYARGQLYSHSQGHSQSQSQNQNQIQSQIQNQSQNQSQNQIQNQNQNQQSHSHSQSQGQIQLQRPQSATVHSTHHPQTSPHTSPALSQQPFSQFSQFSQSVRADAAAHFPMAPAGMKRQSASPHMPVYAYSGYSNSASTVDSQPTRDADGSKHRLAQQSKPRPVSFQVQSPNAFELVDGSSLYAPRASQPRVEISREPSKSGEISRPLALTSEKAHTHSRYNSNVSATYSSGLHLQDDVLNRSNSQAERASANFPGNVSANVSESIAPSYSANAAGNSVSAPYAGNAAPVSQIPRSISAHAQILKSNTGANPAESFMAHSGMTRAPTMPSIASSPRDDVRWSESSGRPNRTSMQMRTRAPEHEKQANAGSSKIKSRLSSALWYRSSSGSRFEAEARVNSTGNSAAVQSAKSVGGSETTPFADGQTSSVSTYSNSNTNTAGSQLTANTENTTSTTSTANTVATALTSASTMSDSHLVLSNHINTGNKDLKNISSREILQHQQLQEMQQKLNLQNNQQEYPINTQYSAIPVSHSEANLNENSQPSGIPVKSNKDQGMNFKRRTLNFFKRRSMA